MAPKKLIVVWRGECGRIVVALHWLNVRLLFRSLATRDPTRDPAGSRQAGLGRGTAWSGTRLLLLLSLDGHRDVKGQPPGNRQQVELIVRSFKFTPE